MAGAAVTIAVGGCSLLVSTDGLASSADAAPGATDGGGADTSAGNATGSDGGSSDAAADASDASTGPFCASLSPKPKFCADFDQGGTAGDYGSIFGTPSLDVSTSKSAPASLLAIVETSASVRGSAVQTNLSDTPTAIALSFDVFVDEYDSAHDVELVTVNYASAGNLYCDVNVAVRSNMWTVGEYCQMNGTATGVAAAHHTSSQLMRGKWTHIDVTAAVVSGGALTMAVDGVKAFDGTMEPGFVTGKTAIVIGIPYLQTVATSRSKVFTDNVVYDYH